MKSWASGVLSFHRMEILFYWKNWNIVLFTWKLSEYWVVLCILCEMPSNSPSTCPTEGATWFFFSLILALYSQPIYAWRALNYSISTYSLWAIKYNWLPYPEALSLSWGFTINQDKQHIMKSTAVCIKDAFQNKSFLVNTGLYVYLHHNNQSSESKSYHFTYWDLYFTYSFSTVLILSWNRNLSNWLFPEDTHCF